jgi:IS30 family transposase
MLDRVAERRRAAQLARHYRDEEGLSIAEIGRRLGRAEATIKAYLYDPTGDKARAVKARYRGSVSRLRGAHRATERQRRRLRVLQTLPSRRDRAAMDTGGGSRSDARMASALRRCAVLL